MRAWTVLTFLSLGSLMLTMGCQTAAPPAAGEFFAAANLHFST